MRVQGEGGGKALGEGDALDAPGFEAGEGFDFGVPAGEETLFCGGRGGFGGQAVGVGVSR